MAIVKLQNGNVLLKDGKVSCSCCAVTECCLYPASALLDGLYSGEDLPENVTIFGTSVPRELGDRLGYSDGRFELFAYNGQWELQDTAVEPPTFCSQDCLVDDICDIQDQFADSYTGTYGIYDPITLTRVSLCEWTGEGVGTEDQPYTVSLIYETDYKWHVKVEIDSVNYDWIKDDPQSSPEGNFEGNFTVS